MADIITKDSEEFKELAGWIRRAGKAAEEAMARIRPTMCARGCTSHGGHCKPCVMGTWCPILPSVERFFIPKADCMRY